MNLYSNPGLRIAFTSAAMLFLALPAGCAQPPSGLPRLGNWVYPGADKDALAKCLSLGIGFSSNRDDPRQERLNFESGIATNHHPGRPSAAELLAGLSLTAEDRDQDSQGESVRGDVQSSVFHEAVPGRFAQYIKAQVKPLGTAPWVCSFMIPSPVSTYGEAHYDVSISGRYAVFSRPAKENFRRWLQSAYHNDLNALSHAWGRKIPSWASVIPPEGPSAGQVGIDTRCEWSDFAHWYNWWLDEITWRSLKAVREETGKPIGAMLGGFKVGYSQGILLGNVGPLARMLGKVRPSFFNDTDGQTLFSARYTRAACSQYGVELMLENVGPPCLEPFHQYNMALNVLSSGADHAHLAHLGELFDSNHWFSRLWKGLAPVVLRYRTAYRKSDAAIFHSYMTSWYRPSRENTDAVSLYDSTNTLWTPDKGYPSWGRALGSPDVVDDAMVEDGALRGRKLLVIPNSSVTVTSRKAVNCIREWVKAGGTLLGFGAGCLAYTVESDRSLKSTAGMAGLIPTQKISKALSDPTATRIEHTYGKGRVILYLKAADPALMGPSGKPFVNEMMPALAAEADRAGAKRWCRVVAGPQINLVYCGRDLVSGRHLFTADFTRSARNGAPAPDFYTDCSFGLSFSPELKGDAELVGLTDSFKNCEGGSASYSPETRVLTVRFTLPAKLKLTFGRPQSNQP